MNRLEHLAGHPVTGPGQKVDSPRGGADQAALLEKAKTLEAVFLAQMLELGGLGAVSDSFGGGLGEAQFASFLREEQARLMVERGGIGLAEHLFRALSGEAADV